MGAVVRVLESHGVRASEEEVARAMDVALVESGFQWPYPDPRKELKAEHVSLLERGGFDLGRLEFDLEDPIARAAMEYAVIRATALTTHEAAKRLGANDSRVRQRLAQRALYGIKVGDEWRLPENLTPVAVHRWFQMPDLDLEAMEGKNEALTPLQWLACGNDPEVVAELAAGL